MNQKQPSKRGFAAMTEEKRKSIAALGGKRAHQLGTAHKFTSSEAAMAGRKGGKASGKSREKLDTGAKAEV